jgi:hypothetical protein
MVSVLSACNKMISLVELSRSRSNASAWTTKATTFQVKQYTKQTNI